MIKLKAKWWSSTVEDIHLVEGIDAVKVLESLLLKEYKNLQQFKKEI